MNGSLKAVLLIEDNRADARLLREMIREESSNHAIAVTCVESMGDAEKHLQQHVVDLVVLDLGLPDAVGTESLRRTRAAAPRVPLVVLTGRDDNVLAIEALQQGAQDYLVKGQMDGRGLLRALHYAVERKLMEEALFEEKERAQVTLSCIGDAVMSADAAGNITFLNPVAVRLTGWTLQEATGRPVSDVFRILDVLEDEATLSAESGMLARRDGVKVPIESTIAPIHDRDGRPTGAVIVFRDMSAARAMTRLMVHAAEHDFLTGLPNRMLLKERIAQAIVLAHRHSTRVAVLFLDLDGFKHINDSLGHLIGDQLLQSIGKRLVERGRASDTVSRQGGDEFIILLSEVEHAEDAAIAANRILQAIAESHAVEAHDLHVTASIGVSIYPEDGQDAETLIKNADTAMYQAKENGNHGYQYFKPAMNARAVERQSIEASLRRAIERGEFRLHYQPKVNFSTGKITGAEALLRWTHPSRGSVSPAQFIPVAEDCGLIVPIGAWVLEQACRQARAWVDQGLPVSTMAVNVSAMQFRNDGFLERLFALLRESHLDPSLLELEITEGVLMKHAEYAAAILHKLRDGGVQVAVDDFGTGYSSLSYLRKFPVDALKIDQSFVGHITTVEEDASIVTAVIRMAQSLKLRVIAEGVETFEQLRFLQARACDEAQGYYFSRPVPAEEFAELLRAGLPKASMMPLALAL